MLGLQHPLSLFQAALPPLLCAMLPSAATTSPTSPSADGDPPSALPAGADPPSEKKRNKQSTRSVLDTLQRCIGEGCGEKLYADLKRFLNKTPQQQHLTIFEDLEKTCSCARGSRSVQGPTLYNLVQPVQLLLEGVRGDSVLPQGGQLPRQCPEGQAQGAHRANFGSETQPFCPHWGCLSCA